MKHVFKKNNNNIYIYIYIKLKILAIQLNSVTACYIEVLFQKHKICRPEGELSMITKHISS